MRLSFDTFVIFSILLTLQILSCSATRTYHVNHQKVSKYYKNDCLDGFLLLFMSLLTVPVVRNSHN